MTSVFPKRLIEVDLPIARISEHARRDKTGSISTLHIWWARRPLAACRAVICAAIWPDPADEHCPESFRVEARRIIHRFSERVYPEKLSSEGRLLQSDKHSSNVSRGRWQRLLEKSTVDEDEDTVELRDHLLNFLADFAIKENSTVPAYLETGRALTVSAHEALGGISGTRPLVADPFAGGGAIPLEALRVGADSFASDLNPVPILLNTVLLDYIPRFGRKLSERIQEWGDWVKGELVAELASLYPTDSVDSSPVGYIWARTISCEGASCGAEVPLMRSLSLANKPKYQVALQLQPMQSPHRIELSIIQKEGSRWFDQSDPSAIVEKPSMDGTVKGGSVTCPCCGYTTPVARVRVQLGERHGGSRDARLMCVASSKGNRTGKSYRLPEPSDFAAIEQAARTLDNLSQETAFGFSAIPDEATPPDGTGSKGGGYRTRKYGVTTYGDFFNTRQLVQHLTISKLLRRVRHECGKGLSSDEATAVQTIVALTANRQIDRDSAFCRWNAKSQSSAYTFGRQAIPMLWDFVETPALFAAGVWDTCISNVCRTIDELADVLEGCGTGQAVFASATEHPLPDDSVACFVTDPPYYDSVPYAELSDFFLVWLKRSLGDSPLIQQFPQLSRRDVECVVNLNEGKDKEYFQETMTKCLAEGRRICNADGIGIVVFAHKSTAGWESQLKSMIDAGWTITASWPLDTEMAHRLRAHNSAALTSSIHLVCRPRHSETDSETELVGEWRDVLSELPRRIHEWMPRLAAEGVVGADAIFACLGPALEIFSRYSRVEKASGDEVELREYLEHVWASVSTEALSMIFDDADAAGLEPDARLTAMWLWTRGVGAGSADSEGDEKAAEITDFVLEYDAARKIAQGLGIRLEDNESIVEVSGSQARLLPAGERTAYLFASKANTSTGRSKKKTVQQRSLFEELDEIEAGTAETEAGELKPHAGETVLDRLHQSMILFAAGRGEALRRFLVDDGAAADARFWKLAQSLSALYPKGTDEKRWVDGVLARKKGLGL